MAERQTRKQTSGGYKEEGMMGGGGTMGPFPGRGGAESKWTEAAGGWECLKMAARGPPWGASVREGGETCVSPTAHPGQDTVKGSEL